MHQVRSKHYFVADVHLGVQLRESIALQEPIVLQKPFEREKGFVDWLNAISTDALALYLLGDIFDFWWEYKCVVPKGYVRVLGTLAHLVDSGVAVHFFKGNHDRWSFGYLEREVGIHIHHKPEMIEVGGTRFCLGHGDGVEGRSGRFLQTLFSTPSLQRCFAAIHPRWGMALGHRWSAHNRKKERSSHTFSKERDHLTRFAQLYPHPVDYFVFGHLHTPVDITLPNGARFVVLGEWMHSGCYAQFDEGTGKFCCIDYQSVVCNEGNGVPDSESSRPLEREMKE